MSNKKMDSKNIVLCIMKSFFILSFQLVFLSIPLFAQKIHNVLQLKTVTSVLPNKYETIIVSKDGKGDYKTVQEAIDAVADYNKTATVIFIRNGVYKEKLHLDSSKINVFMVGESLLHTILTYDDFASKKDSKGNNIGTSGSASFFIFGSGFHAENITFQNSAGPVGQAVAVRISADRAVFVHCRFLGFQDTLYTHGIGREYYYKCYIEGTVDFIFGAATVLFDSCTIFGKSGGFYTAASTPESSKIGYVFLHCKITGNAPPESFYLGRPWRPFAKTVFIQCEMDKTVKPEGWFNWDNEKNERTAFYAEYKSFGSGANPASRASWSSQLTDSQAKCYNANVIFGNWRPLN